VGVDQLGTTADAPLAGGGWPSSTRTPPLVDNATRPGQAKVYPGEVGLWRVHLSAYGHAAGTYSMTLRPVGTDGLYGPSMTVTTKVVQASLTASLYAVTSNVSVPSNGYAKVTIYAKNTGNVIWPVGGLLRTRILTSSSPSYHSSWINSYRPGTLTSNFSRAGSTVVRPGEVGRFTFVLAGNGRAPQSASERFGLRWDGWLTPSFAATVTYRIV
jgi:hypothetical protein